MSSVEASLAGPKRPQDRVALGDVPKAFAASGELEVNHLQRQRQPVDYTLNGHHYSLPDGAVAIAAITSCTNTSNPSVLMAAGLLAKKAVERGLQPQPWVKASLAPGSKVVSDYLAHAGLTSTSSASIWWDMVAPPVSVTPVHCLNLSKKRSKKAI